MMYCPKCGAEYRDGFTECADCEVPLAERLSSSLEGKPQFVDLESVLTTTNHGEMALVESLLDAEDIPYLAQGEAFTLRAPVPVRFLVRKEDAARAREVLAELLESPRPK